jgi:plasmid replication initiation protein
MTSTETAPAGKLDHSFTQSNDLIEASYAISLNEKRLLVLGISKLNPQEWPSRSFQASFSVTAAEWMATFPEATEHPYQAIQRASDGLIDRSLVINHSKKRRTKMNWVDSIEYRDGEARVDVTLTRAITVQLMGCQGHFTKINLLSVSRLNSVYSIRLYELALQFRSTGVRRMSLDDFRSSMGCEGCYANIKDLKKRVIHPALLEINTKTPYRIEHKDMRTGRRITGVEFRVRESDQPDLFAGD